MIALFFHHLETFFGWLLAASWQASVLALLVLGLQRVLRAKLNPRWRYALWLLVLARLVLPALPESALSLFQFAPPPPASLIVPVTEPLFVQATLPAPQNAVPSLEPSHPFSAYTLLAVIWLLGAISLLILTWQVNRRFARQVAHSPEITDPELLESFAAAKKELGIHRTIRLIESGQVQSPAIMGLFQPTLLLPADVRDKFDECELRFIFLHELAHLKRGDVIAQGLIALLQILHWFNPVLWFAFRRMRIDREPATDALVLSRTGEEEKERYGLMLIKLLEHFNQRHSLPTLVGILEDKDQFKRRFSLIARFTRGAYGWSPLGVLLIGILAVAGLTKSKTLISHSGTQKQMLEAVQKGDAATLQKLIDQGVDPKTVKSGYPTLLFEAGSPEVAEILIAHGVDVNARDTNEDTLSHFCASGLSPSGEKDRAEIIRVLLKHGANPNAPDSLGYTPIVFARDGATVDALVEFGAKVDIQTKDGRDLMDFDHSSADLSYFQALERHGYSFAPDAHGSQLLVAASHTQNLEVMKWLLDRGVDPNTKGIWVKSNEGTFYQLPLQTAAIFGNTEAARLLISHGAKADEPMITALHNGYGKIVKLFWESGVRNISELCYAVSQGAPVADLQKLLDQGIPADPLQDKRITPLGVAAMLGNMDAVKLLVAHNANVNAGQPINPKLSQYYKMSPLIMASGEGQDEIVDYLLQHSATPDPAAIWQAAENSHPYPSQRTKDHFEKTVRILIDAGALKTTTPELAGMILAASIGTRNPGGNATVLKMLLDAGLSPELPLTDEVGKQTSVIGYYRDWCIKNKDNITDIKPLLDILEAADKGAETKTTDADAAPKAGDMFTVRTFLPPAGFFQAKAGAPVDVRQELISRGVEFPREATVTVLADSGKLVVRNTPEQLDKIATLIETFPKVPWELGAVTNPLEPKPAENENAPSIARSLNVPFSYATPVVSSSAQSSLSLPRPGPQGLTLKGYVNASSSMPSRLNRAIGSNDYDAVKSLLDEGTKADANDMQEALRDGRQGMVRLLWEQGPPHYCSELAYAISQDEPVEKIKELLDKGAPVTSPEDSLITPLGLAAQRGNIAVAQLLLSRGAGVNPVNAALNPLDAAAGVGKRPDMVDFLLKSGAKVTERTLISTIVWGTAIGPRPNPISTAIMERLIQTGALKNIPEDEAAELLILACQKQNAAILRQLLDAGLNPLSRTSSPNGHGPTALAVIQSEQAGPNGAGQAPLLDMLEKAAAEKNAKAETTDTGAASRTDSKPPLDIPEVADAQIEVKNIAQLTAKLDSIHIDLPSFSEAPLGDVILLLVRESQKADPAGAGIHPIMVVDGAATSSARITLPSLKDVSIFDALQAITTAGDLKFDLKDHVIIRAARAGGKTFSVKTFAVPAGFFQAKPGAAVEVTQELIQRGIEFPIYSTATYLPAQNRLVVRDAPGQLDKIEALLNAKASPNPTPKSETGSPATAPAPPNDETKDLTALKKDLLMAREDADARRVLLDRVKDLPDDQFLATLAALGRTDPTITALQKEIADKNVDIAGLLKGGVTENDSRIQSMRTELAALQQESRRLTDGLHSAMALDHQMADSRVALLQKEVDSVKAQTSPSSGTSR